METFKTCFPGYHTGHTGYVEEVYCAIGLTDSMAELLQYLKKGI